MVNWFSSHRVVRVPILLLGAILIALLGLTSGLIWVNSTRLTVLLIPLLAGCFYFAAAKPEWIVRFVFLTLPLSGLIGSLIGLHFVPTFLPVIFVLALGRLWSVYWRTGETRYELSLPTAVWFFAANLVLSSVVGLAGIAHYFRDSSTPLIYLPWDEMEKTHAVGWIAFFFLVNMAGVVFFELIKAADPSRRKSDVHFLFISLLIPTFFAVVQYAGWSKWGPASPSVLKNIQQFGGTFSDHNALAYYVAFVFPFWVQWACESGRPWYLWMTSVLLAVSGLIAASRSASFATVVSFVIVLFLLRNTVLNNPVGRVAKRVVAVVLIVFCLIQIRAHRHRFINFVMDSYRIVSSENSVSTVWGDRNLLWRAGVITFKHNWFLGTGLGTYLFTMPNYKDEIGPVYNDNSGNMYLHVAAEQGIVGLAIFINLLLCAFLSYLYRSRLVGSGYEKAAVSIFIGLCAVFLFGSHIITLEINLMFWYVLATLFGAKRTYE